MKFNARIALAALLIVAAACHKNSKEAQLKALDEAYKSGVFTKEEYDAKKQALVGTPAAAPAPPAAAVAPAPADATPSAPAPDQNPPTAALPDPPAAPPPNAATAPAPAQALPPPVPAQPAPVHTPPAAPQAAPAPDAPQPATQTGEPEPAPSKGCPDAEARAGGPNGAQERFFPASEDAVRSAALQAFSNLDFTVHNSIADAMEASKKGRAGTERVILRFESTSSNGQDGTKVVGETKRGIMGRVTQKPWTGAVLAQIECNLRGGR